MDWPRTLFYTELTLETLTFLRVSSSDSSVRDDALVNVAEAAEVEVRDVVLNISSRRWIWRVRLCPKNSSMIKT